MENKPNKPKFSLLKRQEIYILALCEHFDDINDFDEDEASNTLYAFIGELKEYGYSLAEICRLMQTDIILMTECCNSMEDWVSYFECFYMATAPIEYDLWCMDGNGVNNDTSK